MTPQKARAGATQDGPEGIAAVARGVPGVARLAPVLGARPVRLADGHAFVQLTTVAGHRALEVARAVRAAVTAAAPAARTVAVLVTAVEGNFSGRCPAGGLRPLRRPGTPVRAVAGCYSPMPARSRSRRAWAARSAVRCSS